MTTAAPAPQAVGATPASGPAVGGQPGAPPPDGTSFLGALEGNLARTATAEGQAGQSTAASTAAAAPREAVSSRDEDERDELSQTSGSRTEEGTHTTRRPHSNTETAQGEQAVQAALLSVQHRAQAGPEGAGDSETTQLGEGQEATADGLELSANATASTGALHSPSAQAGATIDGRGAHPGATAVAAAEEAEGDAAAHELTTDLAPSTTSTVAAEGSPDTAADEGATSIARLLAQLDTQTNTSTDESAGASGADESRVPPREASAQSAQTATAQMGRATRTEGERIEGMQSDDGHDPSDSTGVEAREAAALSPTLADGASQSSPPPTGPRGLRDAEAATGEPGTSASKDANTATLAGAAKAATVAPGSATQTSTSTTAHVERRVSGTQAGSGGASHGSANADEASASGGTTTAATALPAQAQTSVQATAASALGHQEASAATQGSSMQEQIESLRATVELASREGSAQARIALEPEELGAVRIHITQTSQGLLARVSADTEAGAQAVASGQSELHSALSSLGVSLLRLDIGSSAQGEGGSAQSQPQATSTGRRGSASRVEDVEGAASEPVAGVAQSTSETPTRPGSIDVLA